MKFQGCWFLGNELFTNKWLVINETRKLCGTLLSAKLIVAVIRKNLTSQAVQRSLQRPCGFSFSHIKKCLWNLTLDTKKVQLCKLDFWFIFSIPVFSFFKSLRQHLLKQKSFKHLHQQCRESYQNGNFFNRQELFFLRLRAPCRYCPILQNIGNEPIFFIQLTWKLHLVTC